MTTVTPVPRNPITVWLEKYWLYWFIKGLYNLLSRGVNSIVHLVFVAAIVAVALGLFSNAGWHMNVYNDEARNCTKAIAFVRGPSDVPEKYVLFLDEHPDDADSSQIKVPCFLKP